MRCQQGKLTEIKKVRRLHGFLYQNFLLIRTALWRNPRTKIMNLLTVENDGGRTRGLQNSRVSFLSFSIFNAQFSIPRKGEPPTGIPAAMTRGPR
jgi:hypothetical protein